MSSSLPDQSAFLGWFTGAQRLSQSPSELGNDLRPGALVIARAAAESHIKNSTSAQAGTPRCCLFSLQN